MNAPTRITPPAAPKRARSAPRPEAQSSVRRSRTKPADVSDGPEAHELYEIRREVERLNERVAAFLEAVPRGSAFDRLWARETHSGRRDLEFLGTALSHADSAMTCDGFDPPSKKFAAFRHALALATDFDGREQIPARLDERDADGPHRSEAVA